MSNDKGEARDSYEPLRPYDQEARENNNNIDVEFNWHFTILVLAIAAALITIGVNLL